jgi:hypothetical protein
LRKASKYNLTAVSISLPTVLLRQIDERADQLGIPRSQYLALLARKDIVAGGPLSLPVSHPDRTPKQIDLTEEVIAFLKFAHPILIEREKIVNEADTKPPPLEVEPPDSLAEKAFWLGVMDELDEILEYKWLQSEKLGYDIGLDRAIREWLQQYYTAWAAENPPPQDQAPPS